MATKRHKPVQNVAQVTMGANVIRLRLVNGHGLVIFLP